MKKIFTVALVALSLAFSTNTHAQGVKLGYISVDNMVGLMPETAKIDSLMEKYQTDSLNPQYAYIVGEYQRKDSMYRDSLHTPAAVRKQIGEELPTLIYQIQNWQSIVQQASEAKQNEYLKPIYTKVYDAIKAVAKEKGYTHIFNKEAFLVAPEGDDIILQVAAKLKVNVPQAAQKPVAPGKGN